jgi:outer membrane lipoprotein-sorting protein
LFRKNIVSVVLVVLAVLPLSLSSQTPEERGLEIATEADLRDTGWGDSRASMVMTLRNKKGQESKREIRNQSMEVDGDGDKALSIFDSPADVKGTAFLSFTHAIEPDDQWLYLPALKRVKRIASANKSGPFMGSEFAFEDLSSQEIEKYNFVYVGDEQIDGIDMYMVERRPRYKHSGYTRQVVWLDKEYYRPFRIDYYGRRDALLKTLTQHEYQRYLEKYWRPGRMEMLNHQTGKSTTIVWRDYSFGNGLTDRDFDQSTLRRAR